MSLPSEANAILPTLPDTGKQKPKLTRHQKATIIVRLLQSEGIDLSLADLPDDLQIALAQEMAKMRHVNRLTLDNVVSEFVTELDDLGLSFPRGVPNTLSAIEGNISETAAAKIREAAGNVAPKDPWTRISEMPEDQLLELLEAESIEVAAVVLTKLQVTKSAEVMGRLPGERARRIAYTMSRTHAIAPHVVDRIGDSLVAQLQTARASAFDGQPADIVGGILNFARASTREDVLAGLIEEDQEFGEAVKKTIFTFVNIRDRIDPRDVPAVTREVDPDVFMKAMAAASALEEENKSVEFILENMSQRMATQLREDMAGLGKIKEKDGEEAMTAVIGAIRRLLDNGDIELVAPEDVEEPA